MKIAKDVVVSLAYQVRTEDGVLVDEAPIDAPLDYLHGHGALISGLENSLEGREVGDRFDVEVTPDQGYGEYNEALVQRVPKDVFVGVDNVDVGMRFLADTDMGPVPVEITAVDGDEVTVDGNHMLAGQNLKFNVEIVGLREATEEELQHGHIHGGHGGCGCGDDSDECCGGGHHDDAHECCGGHGHENEDDHCCGGKGHGHHHGNGSCKNH